jgi:c-di-AMP phosphodiesterase-like protein
MEKWQDGVVQSLTMTELQTLVNLWKNDSERAVLQQVVDELTKPTYEVVLQFQERWGDDRHLVEIRKYANDDHQLWRDRHLLKRLNPEEFAMERQMKQQWEVERRGVKVTVSVVIWSKSDKHIEECPVSMYMTFQDVIDALELKGVKEIW